jgi:hypothetical protein
VTRDELARAAAVASRAAAAEAKLVKGEGVVPAGAWFFGWCGSAGAVYEDLHNRSRSKPACVCFLLHTALVR